MIMRDTFCTYHPFVTLCYFIVVMAVTMLVMHPFLLFASFAAGAAYSILLNGRRAARFNLLGVLPMALLAAVLNPMFNHAGVTILGYMGVNPITLESILFGAAAATAFASVVMWFSCYNRVMTSDKFIYLFGRVIPALSLIISMALRFVPRFKERISETAEAQKCIGRGAGQGNVFKRARHGLRILSIVTTWALESAVTTADSMRSRGYGLRGRTAFSMYRFDGRDAAVSACMGAALAVFLAAAFTGNIRIRFFPSIKINPDTPMAWLGCAAFALFCFLPVILRIREDIIWRSMLSKI